MQLVDLFIACKDLLQQWSSKALEEWLQVFNDMLQLIQFDSIKKECTNLAILLSEASQPLESKMCAAMVFGYLSNVMPFKEYEIQFLSCIRSLCHDFNWQVRKMMCESLNMIITSYRCSEAGKELFVEEILNLVFDYEEEVRGSSIITFISCFKYFMSTHSKQIYTVVKSIFQKMTDKIALPFSERIGVLISGVKTLFS